MHAGAGAVTSGHAWGTIVAMANEDEGKGKGVGAWLGDRAGLIILVVIAAVVGLRLMSSWIKWLLIAMVVGAAYYLVKGALNRSRGEAGE